MPRLYVTGSDSFRMSLPSTLRRPRRPLRSPRSDPVTGPSSVAIARIPRLQRIQLTRVSPNRIAG